MKKIFIACQGLMADRILETCRDMEVSGVTLADPIDVADFQAALDKASALKVDAVHPGDSPWAPQASFAEAVTDRGLAWIGPNPSSLRAAADEEHAPPRPEDRLIDVQVFGFGGGEGVHLFHRDVSVQRDGQTWIVEAPSLLNSAAANAEIFERASTWLRQTNHVGPATLRFGFDRDRETFSACGVFPFLNDISGTTELITGIDLIGSQIDLAAGRLEPVTQELIEKTGHALACQIRIAGASPDAILRKLEHPADLDDLRIDPAFEEGARIPAVSGTILMNVVLSAPDRGTAMDLMLSVLEHVTVEGVETNQAALMDILRDPVYRLALPSAGYLENRGTAPG